MRGKRLNWREWQILRIWVSEDEDKLETMSLTDSRCLSAWLMSADPADPAELLSRSLNCINVPICCNTSISLNLIPSWSVIALKIANNRPIVNIFGPNNLCRILARIICPGWIFLGPRVWRFLTPSLLVKNNLRSVLAGLKLAINAATRRKRATMGNERESVSRVFWRWYMTGAPLSMPALYLMMVWTLGVAGVRWVVKRWRVLMEPGCDEGCDMEGEKKDR